MAEDYTDTYEGPQRAAIFSVDELLEGAGQASEEELSDRLVSSEAEDEAVEDDLDGANDAFEGNGL